MDRRSGLFVNVLTTNLNEKDTKKLKKIYKEHGGDIDNATPKVQKEFKKIIDPIILKVTKKAKERQDRFEKFLSHNPKCLLDKSFLGEINKMLNANPESIKAILAQPGSVPRIVLFDIFGTFIQYIKTKEIIVTNIFLDKFEDSLVGLKKIGEQQGYSVVLDFDPWAGLDHFETVMVSINHILADKYASDNGISVYDATLNIQVMKETQKALIHYQNQFQGFIGSLFNQAEKIIKSGDLFKG